MLIPDPLRPYADLIRVGLWCLLAGGLFVAGCNHGKDRQSQKDLATIAESDKARGRAEADAAENLRAANACGALLAEVNRQTQRAIDEAQRQQAAAKQAADQAQAEAQKSQRRAAQAEKSLQAAKTQPVCRQQLEQTLCDAIPLL